MTFQAFFKKICCLIIYSFILPISIFGMRNDEFIHWWTQYRVSPKIPLDLKNMVDHFIHSRQIDYSSNFWNALNRLHIEQIVNFGYENFKQTVTRSYFTWVVTIDHGYAQNLKRLAPNINESIPEEGLKKIHQLWSSQESYDYNTITHYFLNYMLSIGAAPYLETLEEPLIGNPPFLTYNGKRISQDIFNSLLEYLPIAAHCSMDKISTIIEVGAGSGRTAFCFISLHPGIKYVIVDIPPALYVSQRYLSEVFPDKKIMHFRQFENFDDIAYEFAQADLVFLSSDQLHKLPDKSGSLFLAIDCLHEMKPEFVSYYFKEADRLCSYMYFKCWESTVVPFDNIHHSSGSYPVPSSWNLLFKEPCVVPSGFFHAFYKIPENSSFSVYSHLTTRE